MLELYKKVLSAVSFDNFLFQKELIKALKSLQPTDILSLQQWCIENFGESHFELIRDTFELYSPMA